ncbi:alcohol dehydrogenase [Devosia pacifica]|uniref:Alcohol dehydrogenase n=1 Tax=Devosia pacifica TaxID=1335967 RepID=A0A918VR32_9HYPH|nr:NAD(P)-dependent alcohol dehydrogenase [Devosia pacifica]GHA16877.1 alcohol dehydrogenase [Devosia pacifica]
MKAAVHTRYGNADVVTVSDVPRPEISGNQILVQVYSSAVTTADWRFRASDFPGIMWLPGRLMAGAFRPRKPVLGSTFAGRVVSVGPDVKRFRLGDPVFGVSDWGAHAEYVALSEDGPVVAKPEGITYDEAAATPFGALAALGFVRDFLEVLPGQKVLVAGASGGVGIFAVQIAKQLGAEVTAITSTGNIELVTSLGADHVIDYRKQDLARIAERFDRVIDTASTLKPRVALRLTKPGGRFAPVEFDLPEMLAALGSKLFSKKSLLLRISSDKRVDLEHIAERLADGSLRPVIDSTYPLGAVADAHRKVESRHKTGAVILNPTPAATAAIAA